MPRALRTAAAVLALALATTAALEIGARVLVQRGLLPTPAPPGFAEPYWVGDRPDFGVWRQPNASFRHQTACFDATYETNSVGARDAERPRHASPPRVVVLGDSFTEGWGVDADARWSNRLEHATGVPHLNFGMAHFSPYQSYLVYRDLAKQFSHDAVVIAVLPLNDFADLDYAWASGRQAGYLYRYRPYLVQSDGGWQRFDWREPPLARLLRRGSYAWNALLAAWQRVAPDEAPEPVGTPGSPRVFSFFYDASPDQIALLEHVLGLLADEAKGKKVAVVLLPGLRDLRRHAFSGPDPLSPQLEAFGRDHGMRVVSLLAPMAAHSQRWSEYYLPCDYHFSALGHQTVAELLERSLAGWLAPAAATHE